MSATLQENAVRDGVGKSAGVGLHVADLTHSYDHKRDILRNIDFSIRAGEFVSILGGSGCGKSTLLRLVAGIAQPTRGRIEWVEGRQVVQPDLGLVPQEPTLMPWRTVFGNVYLPMQLARISQQSCRADIMRSLEAMGIAGSAGSYPRQLSGGMKIRVSIARALVARPDALLMDEPFAAR